MTLLSPNAANKNQHANRDITSPLYVERIQRLEFFSLGRFALRSRVPILNTSLVPFHARRANIGTAPVNAA
jgi:hypothetical protein